ncbi:MAG TPA: hypothetical protein DGT23_00950 [Micromonosporaceae bacterium]|nr:hypothetical protein [Micromonosporaceae bacterium]
MALITVLAAIFAMAVPAAAEPTPAPTAPPNETGPPSLSTLRDNLGAAAAGFIKAEADLAASQSKQAELQEQLSAAEADLARVKGSVASYAAQAYMTGRIAPLGLMLQATTQEDLLGRAQVIESITHNDQARLAEYADAKSRADEAKAGIDAEVAAQAVAVQEMAKRKQAAEKALAAAGGTKSRSEIDLAGLPTANPAPRNSDGSWPSEGCTIDDPTTSGCVTPRTLHALSETKRLGFNWYVSCYRPGDRYEHPKGRACDFAAFENGFVNSSAGGANKVYGDRLAAFYVKNAKALGVMYVVWYCQIWQYGVGWHRYNSTGSSCGDSPAGDHTNHVHLSVY